MTEIVKQSQTVRGGQFESSLLTWPGKPNTHIWGTTPPTQLFPFLLVLRDRPTALDYRVRRLCTRALARWYRSKDGGEVCPTPRSDQVLKFTDYHISRHVASTFKSLTKCATHRDLSQFQLFRRDITTTQPHPLSLYFNSKYSQSTPIISREAGNRSTFTGPN